MTIKQRTMKQLNQELLNSINVVSFTGNLEVYSRNYELALNTLIDKLEKSPNICQIVDNEKIGVFKYILILPP